MNKVKTNKKERKKSKSFPKIFCFYTSACFLSDKSVDFFLSAKILVTREFKKRSPAVNRTSTSLAELWFNTFRCAVENAPLAKNFSGKLVDSSKGNH